MYEDDAKIVPVIGIRFIISKIPDHEGQTWVKLVGENYGADLELGEVEALIQNGYKDSKGQRDGIIETVVQFSGEHFAEAIKQTRNGNVKKIQSAHPGMNEEQVTSGGAIYMYAADPDEGMKEMADFIKTLPKNTGFRKVLTNQAKASGDTKEKVTIFQEVARPSERPKSRKIIKPSVPGESLISDVQKETVMAEVKAALEANIIEKQGPEDKHGMSAADCAKAKQILAEHWEILKEPLFDVLTTQVITTDNLDKYKRRTIDIDSLMTFFQGWIVLESSKFPPDSDAAIMNMVGGLMRYTLSDLSARAAAQNAIVIRRG